MIDSYGLLIDTGYACAGIVVRNQRVIRAAPILKYMRDWDVLRVLEYCKKKGWTTKEDRG